MKGLQAARADGHVTVNEASFYVRAGEIYGIAGVGGNGQTELVEALTGVRAPLAGIDRDRRCRKRNGRVARTPARSRHRLHSGRPFRLRPRRRPVGDRQFLCRPHPRGRYGSWMRTDGSAMREATAGAVGDFDVQGVRNLRQRAALLSGGNAQKLDHRARIQPAIRKSSSRTAQAAVSTCAPARRCTSGCSKPATAERPSC